MNTSTFYFCKMFKKITGINFTDYVSRVRIEKSKNLLLNPNLRVSEIAFEVGFQSLTHFNRVFKKILGQSPTEYRAQLLDPLIGRRRIWKLEFAQSFFHSACPVGMKMSTSQKIRQIIVRGPKGGKSREHSTPH